MANIEYYYPLTTLTVKKNNGALYFSCEENKKTNFATGNLRGKSKNYYIQSIDAGDYAKMKFGEIQATKYLVIEHYENSNINLFEKKIYVAIPICEVGDSIGKYTKPDRMNGKLSRSIENLANANNAKTVKFSLEHVISSMKSFKPDGCYVNVQTSSNNPFGTQRQSNISKYIFNQPIYTSADLSKNTFAPSPQSIQIGNKTLTPATIKRVVVKNECNKKQSRKKKSKIFENLSKKEDARLNQLNVIYGIVSLLCVLFFYYIYDNYIIAIRCKNDQDTCADITFYAILTLAVLLLVPITSVVGAYKSGKTKGIDVDALRHSVIFARYFGTALLIAICIIFRKNFEAIFIGGLNNFFSNVAGIITVIFISPRNFISSIVLAGIIFMMYYILFEI